jgi:hypothetical protein
MTPFARAPSEMSDRVELVGRLRRGGLNSKEQLTPRRTRRGVHSASLRLDGIAQLWVNS